MLEASWEPFCTQLANAASDAEVIRVLESIVATFKIDLSVQASVVFAHDTRPSSPALTRALVDGLAAFGTHLIDAGLKTTPQLHYLVLAHNTAGSAEPYGEPTEEGYYKKLAAAYKKLVVSADAGGCAHDSGVQLSCLNTHANPNHSKGRARRHRSLSTARTASERTHCKRSRSTCPLTSFPCESCGPRRRRRVR